MNEIIIKLNSLIAFEYLAPRVLQKGDIASLVSQLRCTINSKINGTPKLRCLLAHFEGTLDFSRNEFTCKY